MAGVADTPGECGGSGAARPKRKLRPSTRLGSSRQAADEAAEPSKKSFKSIPPTPTNLTANTRAFNRVSPSSVASPPSDSDVAAAQLLLGVVGHVRVSGVGESPGKRLRAEETLGVRFDGGGVLDGQL